MIRINISKQIFVGKINKVERGAQATISSPANYQVFNGETITIEGEANDY